MAQLKGQLSSCLKILVLHTSPSRVSLTSESGAFTQPERIGKHAPRNLSCRLMQAIKASRKTDQALLTLCGAESCRGSACDTCYLKAMSVPAGHLPAPGP